MLQQNHDSVELFLNGHLRATDTKTYSRFVLMFHHSDCGLTASRHRFLAAYTFDSSPFEQQPIVLRTA